MCDLYDQHIPFNECHIHSNICHFVYEVIQVVSNGIYRITMNTIQTMTNNKQKHYAGII